MAERPTTFAPADPRDRAPLPTPVMRVAIAANYRIAKRQKMRRDQAAALQRRLRRP